MSVDTAYWEESYYPGMGVPVVPAITPVIATPADGAVFADGAQVVFTGTAEPGATIDVQVRNANGTWTTLVTTTASGDGVWTADPYTVDASSRVSLDVTARDAAHGLRSAVVGISVTPAEVLVDPGDVVEDDHDAEHVTARPLTAWAPGESALFGDGEFHWDGGAWVAGAAPEEEPEP